MRSSSYTPPYNQDLPTSLEGRIKFFNNYKLYAEKTVIPYTPNPWNIRKLQNFPLFTDNGAQKQPQGGESALNYVSRILAKNAHGIDGNLRDLTDLLFNKVNKCKNPHASGINTHAFSSNASAEYTRENRLDALQNPGLSNSKRIRFLKYLVEEYDFRKKGLDAAHAQKYDRKARHPR